MTAKPIVGSVIYDTTGQPAWVIIPYPIAMALRARGVPTIEGGGVERSAAVPAHIGEVITSWIRNEEGFLTRCPLERLIEIAAVEYAGRRGEPPK